MNEKEEQILKNFAEVIPKLPEDKKQYLLGLGEGMALRHEEEEKEVVMK